EVVGLPPCSVLVRFGRVPFATSLVLPFFKDVALNFGWFFVIFGAFIIVGAGNAVNLTDGLDGLAIVPVMIAAMSFGMIAYLTGNAVFSDYLQINYVAGTGELAVLCGAVLGAGLGFLWFNAPPASIFMGDTGSLALGGMLGSIAVAVKHEIVLAVIGGLFVLEAVSVIVQVVSFKLTGKRVFRMAPLHHHFEQKGWTEPQIVIRFWIISVMLALAGDIELFCRERRRHAPDAPLVAITGTNGKSTTTALIAHLMRVAGYDSQMGGNIGTAILSLEPPRTGRVHVIEMSSYQIDLSPSLDPAVGILINISEDHIDRHGALENYAAVKERLVAGVQEQGTAVVGVDGVWC